MRYGQVRDKSLKLINQKSLAGADIARTYNNQADYLRRIPDLVDDAQNIIASLAYRPIQANCELRLEQTRDRLGMPTYRLPEDLLDIRPGGLLVVEDNQKPMRYDTGWARTDETHIILPKKTKDFKGRVFLEYYRRPRSVLDCNEECCCEDTCTCKDENLSSDEPLDCAFLDNSPETHSAIPYYVAAHLVLNEDAFVYSSLYNEWVSRLEMLVQAPQPHRHLVEDAYGLDDVYFTGGEY